MSKTLRDKIFNMYSGRCAYCACSLKSNFSVDNSMPCCPTCRMNKKSMSIEAFRKFIQGRVVALRRDSKAFRMAEDFGLIRETKTPILFYFEIVKDVESKFIR